MRGKEFLADEEDKGSGSRLSVRRRRGNDNLLDILTRIMCNEYILQMMTLSCSRWRCWQSVLSPNENLETGSARHPLLATSVCKIDHKTGEKIILLRAKQSSIFRFFHQRKHPSVLWFKSIRLICNNLAYFLRHMFLSHYESNLQICRGGSPQQTLLGTPNRRGNQFVILHNISAGSWLLCRHNSSFSLRYLAWWSPG